MAGNMYIIPLLYRVPTDDVCVSLARLQRALRSVVAKHASLRTALYLNSSGTILQRRLETSLNNVSNTELADDGMDRVLEALLTTADLFDLARGRVLTCQVLRRRRSASAGDDVLSADDLLLISVHHSVFDGASRSIFARELALAYSTDAPLPVDAQALQYIDYAVHERIIDMTAAQHFWRSQLAGCDLRRVLALPVDRHRASTDQRSGLACTAEVTFNDDLAVTFVAYAAAHQLTLFQLALATSFAFLFRLGHNASDLCIGWISANRYRSELTSLIGMFVSTLPCRVQIDTRCSFQQLADDVRTRCLSMLQHSHYPLQHLLADFSVTQRDVAFLETLFNFISVSPDDTHLSLAPDARLEQVSLEHAYEVAKFDFSLTFVHDLTSTDGRLRCTVTGSRDLFGARTVSEIGCRLEHFCEELFLSSAANGRMDACNSPLAKLSLLLPEEARELDDVVFCRQAHATNEGMYVGSQSSAKFTFRSRKTCNG